MEENKTNPALSETVLSYEGYSLVWQDDFDDEKLNRNDWNVELHEPGWVNEELQEYVDSEENISLRDGNLIIKPVKSADADGNVSYTSGRITTEHKHDFTYGIFEAKLKVPEGMGYLPAFWLLATGEGTDCFWPVCGEIDIMEIFGSVTDKNYGTIHYGMPHEQNQGSVTLTDGDFSKEFHTFAIKWKPGKIEWYVDGRLFHQADEWHSAEENGDAYAFPAPFDHDFYIIFNLAVGNNWAGYPDETTDFEHAEFAIDYVKVWQKEK
ncbi:MAG: glycoside hydrolase family 16 protein [Lachnospiraceae bacterium]|nr:glycoside hydrolase family 16 protein [Lachnospiraceae bacterium]